jgi:hypothetical protein
MERPHYKQGIESDEDIMIQQLHRKHFDHLPSNNDIMAIPLARCAEFELSEKETSTLRRHLYAVNRDGIRRFRTLRDGPLVIVWRIK